MKTLARIAMLLSIALVATEVSAQRGPAPFQEVVTIDVRPGHRAAWIEYSTKIKEAAAKLGAAQTFEIFHVSIGENLNRFYVVLPFETWADREDWTAVRQLLIRAFGEEEGAAIYQRGTAAEEHVQNSVGRYLPDHSVNVGKSTGQIAPMYQVVQTQVRAHANASYQAWLALLAKAQSADANRRPITRRVTTQGSSWLYTSAWPLDSIGDLDQNPGAGTADFYGESAAGRLADMVGDGVVSRTWFVVHYHPNQSYTSGGGTSN